MIKQELTILVASDIHEAYDNVNKVVAKEKNSGVDFVLLLGDFQNLQHDHADPPVEESQNNLVKLLKPFTELNVPVLAIPGNHDLESLFHGAEFAAGIQNVHAKLVPVAEHLSIYGFGGSTPGLLGQEQVWKGFPFNSEEEFAKLFQIPETEKNTQILLMTHIGPHISQTTTSFERGVENPITSGSNRISEDILKKNIFLNLHGHTHDGVGSRLIAQTRTKVVNVGPLQWGLYGKAKLKLNNDKWSVSSILHENVDS